MQDRRMSLVEHLGELRKRIVASSIVIGVSFVLCFYYSEYIFQLLILPLQGAPQFSLKMPFITMKYSGNPETRLVFLAPAEAFWMHMKISLITAFVISSPVIFYEVWRFISPGLSPKEKKYTLPFVIVATSLFLIGALFCFLIVLPLAIQFLITYKTENLKPMLSVGNYIDFCLKFILAFGAVFELPVILVFLTKTGIVTPDFLAKNRKYAIVLAFVVAAILTPTPDAFNQTLMALPIILLYEAGILASKVLNKSSRDEVG